MNALSSFRDQQFRVVPVKSALADGATTYLSNPPTGPRDKNRCPASRRCLTKRERKCPHARIEELDFEDPLLNSTLLPDELIETGLSNLAGAVSTRAGGPVLLQKRDDRALGLIVVAFSQATITNSSLSIDEVEGGPGLVLERLPNRCRADRAESHCSERRFVGNIRQKWTSHLRH